MNLHSVIKLMSGRWCTKYSHTVNNTYYKSSIYSPPQSDPGLYCTKYQIELLHGLSFHCLNSGPVLTLQNNCYKCWTAQDHKLYRPIFVISHSKRILLEITDYTLTGNTQLHTQTYILTHTHTHIHTRIYTHTQTHIHIYTHSYTYTHT